MSQTFTAVYSDPTGYSNMTEAEILIQPPSFTSFGFYDCYIYYNRYSNSLYLLADAGGPWLGPLTAGSSSTLQNSQCTLNGAGSSVGGSGNTLTVSYSITFSNGYTGAMNVYLLVQDDSSGLNTGYQQMGTWTVGTSCTPQNFVSGSVSPTTVTPGAAYQVLCDYGAQYGYIGASNCSSFNGWQGTAAVMGCTAPSTPGAYAQSCNLGTGPPQYFCARTDSAGTLTVANPSVSVSVSPATTSVPPGQQQQFSATVTGTTNTDGYGA